jgi:hypothetical protein
MSQDQPQTPKENKIKITLDNSLQVAELQQSISAKDQRIGELESTVKNMLIDHKAKFELENKQMGAPYNSESPPLEAPQRKPIDMQGSNLSPNQVCGSSVEQLFDNISKLSHVAENASEYKKIQSKLLKKMLHNPKPLDLTFKGDSKLFLRHDVSIGEFDDEYTKKQKENHNNLLKANRQKWTQGD